MTPEAALKAFLTQPQIAKMPKRLVVACSGGADSVALLRVAVAVAPALGWQVEALHCDHGLRREAKADAVFVAALCEKLGVPLHAFATKLKRGAGMEERARDWRRRCYLKAGAKLVLLAHHAQDQAETLLLNLLRGAGPKGSSGMAAIAAWEGVLLGRPFLGIEPQALRAWLKRKRQAWREDASNRDQTLARNRIRHAVLPQLAAINPKAVANLAAFAALQGRSTQEADLAGLLKLDRGARARAQSVLAAGQGQADLGRGWVLRASQGQVLLDQGLSAGPGDWKFSLKLERPSSRKLKDDKVFWLAPAVLEAGLRVRTPRPGERMLPFGKATGSRLLFDLLAEAGVPSWQRPQWPVICAGDQVLGLPDVRRAQGFEVTAGSPALGLRWERGQA